MSSQTKSSSVIIELGAPATKKVIDEIGTFRPMVAIYESQLGVGLRGADGRGMHWGLLSPQNPITSFRAMKIAEMVTDFESGTLAAIYCLAEASSQRKPGIVEKIDDVVNGAFSRLIGLKRDGQVEVIPRKAGRFTFEVGNKQINLLMESPRSVREDIAAIGDMVPMNLDPYLDALRGVKFSGFTGGREIKREILRGTLKPTPEIREFLDWCGTKLRNEDLSIPA